MSLTWELSQTIQHSSSRHSVLAHEEEEKHRHGEAEKQEAIKQKALADDQKVKDYVAQLASQNAHSEEMIAQFDNPRKTTVEKWQITRQLADVSGIYHDAAELRARGLIKTCQRADVTDGFVRLLAMKSFLYILKHGQEQDKLHDVPHKDRLHPEHGSGVNVDGRETGPIGGFCLSELESNSRVVSGIVELANDNFLPVRRSAVQGIRVLGVAAIGAADRLGDMALTEHDGRLRLECIHALGAFGIQAVEVLYRVLAATTHWRTKIETCHAIAVLTDWNQAKPCEEILDITLRLAELLEDPDEDVRKAACYCLGHMSVKAVARVPKLIVMLRDRHIRVRTAAAWALAEIGYGYEYSSEAVHIQADATTVEENDEKWNAWQKGHTTLKMMLDLSGAASLIEVICRSLTGVIRDLEPFHSFLHEARPDEKVDAGIKSFPAGRAGLDDGSEESIWTPRDQSTKLSDAADKAFERLGVLSLESLCNRLASSEDGGFASRTSVMRSMYATKLMSLPVIACFVSEWVMMDGKHEWLRDKKQIDLWKRSLPMIYEAKLLEYGSTDQIVWALIKRDIGAVVLTFGVQKEHAHSWLELEWVSFKPMDVYDENGDVVGQVNVHAGFYNMLDGCFLDICAALKRSGAADGLHRLNCICICGGGVGGSLAQMMTLRLLCERAPLGEMKLPLAPPEEETAVEATPFVAGHSGLPSEARAKAHGKSKPQPPASVNGALPPQVGMPPALSDAMMVSDKIDPVEEDPRNATHGGLTCITFGATRVAESPKRMPVEVWRMLEAKFQVFRNPHSCAFQFAEDPLPSMLTEVIDVFQGIEKTMKRGGLCSKRKKKSRYVEHQKNFEEGGSLWVSKYGPLLPEVNLDPPIETLEKALYAGEVRYGQFNEAVSRMEIYTNAMLRRLSYLFWSRDEHFSRLKKREDELAPQKSTKEKGSVSSVSSLKLPHIMSLASFGLPDRINSSMSHQSTSEHAFR